jgi:hypothetical protein
MKSLCLILIVVLLIGIGRTQTTPKCFTLLFDYRSGELTNVSGFVVERSTNIVFTNADAIVTIAVRMCDPNQAAFYRVGANP